MSEQARLPLGRSASADWSIATAAKRALAAAEEAQQAGAKDASTPPALMALMTRAVEESQAVLHAVESTPTRRGRQSFAEFTELLGEEIKEAADESVAEAIQRGERVLVKAKSLIEDHFHIDEAFRMLGPLRQDSNRARDAHDVFNLVALLPVVYLNLVNWDCFTFCSEFTDIGLRQKKTVVELWHGEVFDLFWWTTLAYFILDIGWVLVLPSCVKSPGVILKHHLATIGYICIPKLRPEHGWLMGACMIVEVNTWFLIARRALNRRGDKPFQTGVSLFKSLRLMLVSTCFYMSWFIIRLAVYPYLLIVILQEWAKESDKTGSWFNIIAITPVMQCVFMYLNVKWTIDLVRSKLKGRGAGKGL